jgi:hypothetical protein
MANRLLLAAPGVASGGVGTRAWFRDQVRPARLHWARRRRQQAFDPVPFWNERSDRMERYRRPEPRLRIFGLSATDWMR